jgi:hypothetical protein
MLISNSLIFIHNPRTGGNSVRTYLEKILPDTYYPAADNSLAQEQRSWFMHQGAQVAYQYAEKLGINPFSNPALVCVRNPYSHALSGYLYLKQKWNKQAGELGETFAAYLDILQQRTPSEKREAMANAPYGPFAAYLLVNGNLPENLTIAKTESIEQDVMGFLGQFDTDSSLPKFPHENPTEHGDFSDFYSESEEAIVYGMYRNTFESGLYERHEGISW